MDYIKINVSDLVVGQDIMWRGQIYSIVERLGPVAVKVREFKKKKVALREFKNKWYVIGADIVVDRVIT